ncbi:NAD(P)-dependent oxidoreductase [Polaribacter sp. MED152]|uniref:NAD-dependent epimerase/dehydratase family protein n=1 Tax=Polaribacter sp. MED152 TaxID=313598 RepID=UPI000068CAF4|nr:NAD-dependent epimerase/dehydratase family protein [Polaribacter sp. MED152]EAQ42171.1 NAD dependent epimerase/dehydratase family protein [Polaribacter sp. MED152]
MEKVLLTGFSGFLGSTILNFLESENYEIIKAGRNKESDIQFNLLKDTLPKVDVEYVIHVAGKAHVIPKTELEKEAFFKVNFIGTRNLIDGLNLKKLKTFIFISTVAVYGVDSGELIEENHPLKGDTPYALSKIKAEELLIDFGKRNNIKIVILRLPLITGKNPVGNLSSIIKAIQKGYYFRIGEGEAKRSLISALDVANVIPHLMQISGVFNYTDCHHPDIAEIDSIIADKYNKHIRKLPKNLLSVVAKFGDIVPIFPFNSNKFKKLTSTLTFSNRKILSVIDYRPVRGMRDIL